MLKEWSEIKLGAISELITKGTTPTGGNFSDSGINFVKSESLNYEGIIDASKFVFIDETTNQALKRSILKENDILFSIAGIYLGKIGIIKKEHLPANTNQACAIIRLDHKKVDYRFIRQYLTDKSFIKYVNSLTSQSAQPNINLTDLGRIKISIPPLPEQHRIAAVLSAYDDLIETNNTRIAVLAQMAEQLYKEWFVRLRFPAYEAAVFEKGLPKGWAVTKISDFGRVVTGKTPLTNVPRYYGGKFHFIKTPDMHGNMFILETEETLTEDGFLSQKSQILPPNSISVSCIGSAGIVSITTSECMTNQQINTLVLNEIDQLEFLYFTLRALKQTIEMFGSTGATMTNLSKGKFENLKLIKPPSLLIKEFSRKTKPLFDSIKILNQQNLTLKHTRDLLLPRLISGKLRIVGLGDPSV